MPSRPQHSGARALACHPAVSQGASPVAPRGQPQSSHGLSPPSQVSFMYEKLEIDFAGRKLSLETGRLARQAHGSVLATYGDTVVLATAVSQYEARPNMDFLPLTVDYVEKTFAAGKIPGGFFKREGRASEKETLTSRLIDRSMRPLFPRGYDCETQIIVTVLSADRDNDPDMLSLIAASAALPVSDIPHKGPEIGRASCRGRVSEW